MPKDQVGMTVWLESISWISVLPLLHGTSPLLRFQLIAFEKQIWLVRSSSFAKPHGARMVIMIQTMMA